MTIAVCNFTNRQSPDEECFTLPQPLKPRGKDLRTPEHLDDSKVSRSGQINEMTNQSLSV